MIANLSERLQLARSNGGRAAVAYWLASRVLQIQTYKFCGTRLPVPGTRVEPLPDGYEYICINSEEMLAQCDPKMIATLDDHNGSSVAEIIARGGRIYAIVRGSEVASQQRVEFGRSYTESPYPMDLHIGEGEAFFSYLYTSPAQRGRGWARKMSGYIMAHLAAEGVQRCISHTRATNVGSLATRARSGWQVVALLYSFRRKRGFIRRLPAWHEIGCTLQAVRTKRT